jgi:hypothetical protein
MNKQIKSEAKAKMLFEIVNGVFMTDISRDTRKREVVNGRKVYSMILREYGYPFQKIGEGILKDHATIMHYLRDIDWQLKYDEDLKDKYTECRDKFHANDDSPKEESEANVESLIEEVYDLRERIKSLTLSQEDLVSKLAVSERFAKIFRIIKARTPYGMEEDIELKLTAMFNSLYATRIRI